MVNACESAEDCDAGGPRRNQQIPTGKGERDPAASHVSAAGEQTPAIEFSMCFEYISYTYNFKLLLDNSYDVVGYVKDRLAIGEGEELSLYRDPGLQNLIPAGGGTKTHVWAPIAEQVWKRACKVLFMGTHLKGTRKEGRKRGSVKTTLVVVKSSPLICALIAAVLAAVVFTIRTSTPLGGLWRLR